MNDLHWELLAEPREDQYDTKAIYILATSSDSPAISGGHRPVPITDEPTAFDGEVTVRYLAASCPGSPEVVNAPLTHPNIARAADHVRTWPTMFKQFQRLMTTIHPMDLREPHDGLQGSISHSDESKFGTMFGSVFDAVGLAEACVHELAHNKLRAMGVGMTRCTNLLRNSSDELYPSPVKRVGQRPMSAVLHAEYAFLHVVQLDLKLLQVIAEQWRRRLVISIVHNINKIQEGWITIRKFARADERGERFLSGMERWVQSVVAQSKVVVENHPDRPNPSTRVQELEAKILEHALQKR